MRWLNTGSAYFWFFFAALALGAAIARLTRPTVRVDRLALACIYGSIALGLALAGVLVPGSAHVRDVGLAYFSGVMCCVGFAAHRYKVSVGVPLIAVAAVFLALFALSLGGWDPVGGTASLHGDIEVLSTSGGNYGIEVRDALPAGGSTEQQSTDVTGSIPAGPIVAAVEFLTFDPAYFILGSSTVARLNGVVSAEAGGESGGMGGMSNTGGTRGSAAGSESAGVSTVSARYEPWVVRLPGVIKRTVQTNSVTPELLGRYAVLIGPGAKATLQLSESLSNSP